MKLACFGLLLSSLATANGQNLAEVIGNNTDLGILATGISLADLVEATSTAELTIFAPTDEAFSALDPAVLSALTTPEYKFHLQDLLFAHAVPGEVFASNITDGLTVESLNGPLTFSITDEGVFVSGGGFNNSQVVEADVTASNGVVHIVDQVFLPTNLVQTTWQNLEDVDEGFEVLKESLLATGLDAALESSEPLTIFAPGDDVFAAATNVDSYNLTELLLNHAVLGLLPTTLLTDGLQVTTALGLNYTIAVDGESYSIGGVPLVTDMSNMASMNGITHVISGLLLPTVEGEAPVAPPVLAPVAPPSDVAPTMASVPTETPASSAAMVGTFMTMAAMIATTLLW